MADLITNKECIVYMHINKINNKKYIGVTSNSLKIRSGVNGIRYKRCIAFWNAILKYGWDNFEHKIIKSRLTKDEASVCEACLIKMYNTTNPKNGYNISNGGYDGYTITEETKAKISNSKIGIPSKKKGIKYHLSEESKISFKKKQGIKIVQLNKVTKELIKIYDCINDVEFDGFNNRNVGRCVNKKRKTAYGFIWEKYDDYKFNNLKLCLI